MKKFSSLLLAVLLILSLAVPASAALQYDHIDTIYGNLSIDYWGIATCSGSIDTREDRDVKVVVTLQIFNGEYWDSLQTWSGTGRFFASAGGQYAVYSGNQYRTVVTGYVYDDDGTIIDAGTVTYSKYH